MHLISCFSLTHLILSFLETNIRTSRTSSERLLYAQLLCYARGEIFLHIDFTTSITVISPNRPKRCGNCATPENYVKLRYITQ